MVPPHPHPDLAREAIPGKGFGVCGANLAFVHHHMPRLHRMKVLEWLKFAYNHPHIQLLVGKRSNQVSSPAPVV